MTARFLVLRVGLFTHSQNQERKFWLLLQPRAQKPNGISTAPGVETREGQSCSYIAKLKTYSHI